MVVDRLHRGGPDLRDSGMDVDLHEMSRGVIAPQAA